MPFRVQITLLNRNSSMHTADLSLLSAESRLNIRRVTTTLQQRSRRRKLTLIRRHSQSVLRLTNHRTLNRHMNSFLRLRHTLGHRQMTRITTRRRRKINIRRTLNNHLSNLKLNIRRPLGLTQRIFRKIRRLVGLVTRRHTLSLHRVRTRRMNNNGLHRRHLNKYRNGFQTNIYMRRNIKFTQGKNALHITSNRRLKPLFTHITRNRRHVRNFTKLEGNRRRHAQNRGQIAMARFIHRFSFRKSARPIFSNMFNCLTNMTNNTANRSSSFISNLRIIFISARFVGNSITVHIRTTGRNTLRYNEIFIGLLIRGKVPTTLFNNQDVPVRNMNLQIFSRITIRVNSSSLINKRTCNLVLISFRNTLNMNRRYNSIKARRILPLTGTRSR